MLITDPLIMPLHRHLLALSHGDAPHAAVHRMEHLLTLLPESDAKLVAHYYGIPGHQQYSLAELAHERQDTEEQTLAAVSRALRRIAISPEWQSIVHQKWENDNEHN